MQVNTGVFERDGSDTMSDQSFYGALTGSVLWGLTGTAVSAYLAVKGAYNPGLWEVLILGLGLPILGIIIAIKSDSPFISFIGYNLVLIPFGIILGPVVNQYSENVVRNAFAMTAGITFVMGLLGTVAPNFFSKLGAPLFLSLLMLVLVRVAQIFVPELAQLSIIDYIAAGIFSLYIGYDMYRAYQVPRTLNNAIDISIDLYLDILNLFLTLLRIMGSSKNDD